MTVWIVLTAIACMLLAAIAFVVDRAPILTGLAILVGGYYLIHMQWGWEGVAWATGILLFLGLANSNGTDTA